jgi:hypothetical protein
MSCVAPANNPQALRLLSQKVSEKICTFSLGIQIIQICEGIIYGFALIDLDLYPTPLRM